MTTIAFLGTGLLGAALAEAAAKRGDTITAWNRTPAKARALERFGISVASAPDKAVRGVERVHLVLKDDAVVEDVIASLRPGLGAKTVIVDHTTTQPRPTAARAKRLNAKGVRYIHCPVFIGPAAARLGRGTILASGPEELFEEVRPALERMAAHVRYFGERPDLAAVYKLCGNSFIIGLSALVADMLAIAKGSQVSASDALELFEFFDPTATISGRGMSMAAGSYPTNFTLAMARKDTQLMINTAGSLPLAVLPCVAKRMDALIAQGRGAEDLAVIGVDSVEK